LEQPDPEPSLAFFPSRPHDGVDESRQEQLDPFGSLRTGLHEIVKAGETRDRILDDDRLGLFGFA